jgi:hypothetical protein
MITERSSQVTGNVVFTM